jgi:phage shock protein C
MKKVYRSRHTKVLGGVAAGLAEYFDMDVTIMRLIFAVLLVSVPNVIIAYILAWIIVPEEPAGITVHVPTAKPEGAPAVDSGQTAPGGMTADEILKMSGDPHVPDAAVTPAPQGGTDVSGKPAAEARGSGDRSRQFVGFILIAIGAIVIFRRYVPTYIWRLPFNLIGHSWPVLIIIAGLAIILSAVRGR